MDVTPEEILYRQQYNGWTLWCRQFSYRSYRNVYAVYMCRNNAQCHQEVHRVRGVLGNGQGFAGFLIKSEVRKHALAAISDKFSSGLSKQTRGGHWVIVEAAQLQSASPYRLKVCALIDSSDQKRLEREIHKSLKDYRLEGEWFEMTEKQAVEVAVSHGGRLARLYSPRTNLKPKCHT
jgi:hypothetical protein